VRSPEDPYSLRIAHSVSRSPIVSRRPAVLFGHSIEPSRHCENSKNQPSGRSSIDEYALGVRASHRLGDKKSFLVVEVQSYCAPLLGGRRDDSRKSI